MIKAIQKKARELSIKEIMMHYLRITAHIIAESLGYAAPTCAAQILKDAIEGRKNYCEWIYSCYRCAPRPCDEECDKEKTLS